VIVVLRGAITDDCLEDFGRQRGVDLERLTRLFQGRLFAQVNWPIFLFFYEENR
jgi:hypothetical protein